MQGLRGVLGSLSPAERGPLSFLSAYLVLIESLASFQSAAMGNDNKQVCVMPYIDTRHCIARSPPHPPGAANHMSAFQSANLQGVG